MTTSALGRRATRAGLIRDPRTGRTCRRNPADRTPSLSARWPTRPMGPGRAPTSSVATAAHGTEVTGMSRGTGVTRARADGTAPGTAGAVRTGWGARTDLGAAGWGGGGGYRGRGGRRGHWLVYLTVAALAAGIGAGLTVAFDGQGSGPT